MLKSVTSILLRAYRFKKLRPTFRVNTNLRPNINSLWRCNFSVSLSQKSLLDSTGAREPDSDEVDIANIAEGDPEIEKQLKVLILEVDIFRQDGQLVPDKITTDHWRELLNLKNRISRIRYLTFLFKNEKRKENQIRVKEEKKLEREQIFKEMELTGHIQYGFGGNTIFLRIYDSTMDHYLNKNLMTAALFSQHIVIDCSYDPHMTKLEAKNCARQMCMLFAENRYHPQPFHIQFCNVDQHSVSIQALKRYIPPMFDTAYPLFSSPKSYLDLYPKERLVYLTPHCKTDLVEWNHDDVYIIGAMVDKTNPKPLSLAKAKEEGLRMAKLPLERHLLWGSGAGKSFTLNQMTAILLDMRHTGSWETAFKHIPRRKIVSQEELSQENRPRLTTLSKKINRTYRPTDVRVSSEMLRKIKPRKIDITKLYD